MAVSAVPAQMLRRNRGQDQVAVGQVRQRARGGDFRRQGHAGQERRVRERLVDGGHNVRFQRPELHFQPRPHGGLGQRRTPGAAAEHGYFAVVIHVEDHALAPRRPDPTSGLAASSTGQRDRGAKCMAPVSAKPSRKRSSPAQAILAALSVHSASGGATKEKP